MFGFITINRKELAEESASAYQAYYCGLCRKLKSSCGTKGQMLFKNDMTFVVVLLAGLYGLGHEEREFTCPRHPTKKQTAWTNEAAEYAADMNLLLACRDLEDGRKEKNAYAKRAFAKAMAKDYERIRLKYPRQAAAVARYRMELAQREAAGEENLDLTAGLAGEMMAEIFCWKEDGWSEELRCLGFYMGKFVYLMDAYEEREKDQKRGAYNPFLKMSYDREEDFETFAKLILTSIMAECIKSFERMTVVCHADIVKNIMHSGIWARYEAIRGKKKKQENKKKRKPKEKQKDIKDGTGV